MSKEKLINELVESVRMLDTAADHNLLRMVAQRLLQKYNVKEVFSEIVEANKEDIIQGYCQHMLDAGYSTLTVKDRKILINKFLRSFSNISEISTNDAMEYIRQLSVKNSSKNNTVTVLRTFYGWALTKGYVKENIWVGFSRIKEPVRLPKALNIIDLEKIRNACENIRDRALIEVMYSTGARLSEIAGAKLYSLNIDQGTLTVIGKGDKERITFLSQKCLYYLQTYLDQRDVCSEYLFVSLKKPHGNLSNRAIQKILENISIKTNISKKLTPHVLRHTFATLSHEAGMELSDIQDALGHRSADTTRVYISSSTHRAKEAHFKYHIS
jgi:integrase/recombinase XerD